MKKTEFLKEMANKLQENMTKQEIDEQIRFYSDYIGSEIAKGKSEAEVLESLGDPILLARNIMSTKGNKTTYRESESEVKQTSQKPEKSSGKGCLIIGIVALLVVCVILWLAGSIVRLLTPILVPVLVIGILVALMKQRK